MIKEPETNVGKVVITMKDGFTYVGKDVPNNPFGEHDKLFSFWYGNKIRIIPIENISYIDMFEEQDQRLEEFIKQEYYKDFDNVVDKKYTIKAVSNQTGENHSEFDSVLFLAKDICLIPTLHAYRKTCVQAGCLPSHLIAIDTLIANVFEFQEKVGCKIPSTDLYKPLSLYGGKE